MQLSITEQKEEPLLSRTKLKGTLEFDNATPSYAEVGKLIASQLKKEEKIVSIRHIYNSFGKKKAEVMAYVYADESKKQLIEPKVKSKKSAAQKEDKK